MSRPRQRVSAVLRDGATLVARFVRAHPGSFSLAVTGAALFASAIVASALVIGHITDTLIIPSLDDGMPTGGRILPAVAAVVGVATWKAAGITLRRAAAGWFQFRTQADLRAALVEHQMHLRMSWFAAHATGDLLAVTDTDTRQGTGVLGPLPYGTGASLLLVGTLIMIFLLDVVLGFLTLGAMTLVLVLDVWGSWMTFEAFEDVQQKRERVTSVAHESFDGALTVKALGRERWETDRFAVESDGLAGSLERVGRIWGTFRALVDGLPAVTIVVLLVAGAARISTGSLTPGELVSIAYLLSLLSMPIKLIGFVLWDTAFSVAAWRRVETVLNADDLVDHGELAAAPESSGAAVAGEDVSFAYETNGDPVLARVRLDISPGKTVAVVGPTGSGKSTLAVLLARLWDPGTGRITIDGRDLRAFRRSELPREVAFVGQEAFLFDDTVRGNISLGASHSDSVVEEAARLARAAGFIAELPLGYDTPLGERGATLSGGQRQRVALARALARSPRLLVLDDATSAVDPSVESDIIRGLKDAELPSTVVVVAYRRSAIALADEVVYLEDGAVVGHGTHDDLLATVDGYAELIRAYEEDAAARRREREVSA